MQKNGSIRKLWLISKFLVSQTGQQIFTIYILLNISRSKDNQTMNFGQLVEYKIGNIFLEKNHAQNLVGKLVLDVFYKKSKLSISLDQHSEIL